MKKRIGNDFLFYWIMKENGAVINPDEVIDFKIIIRHKSIGDEYIANYDVVNGSPRVKCENLQYIGIYELVATWRVLDYTFSDGYRDCTADVESFQIVNYSAQESNTGNVITSEIAIGFEGLDAYEFWLQEPENLGKTKQQYFDWLQEPASEAVEGANSAAQAANNATIFANTAAEYANTQGDYAKNIGQTVEANEFLRVYAENIRLQNETGRKNVEIVRVGSEATRVNAEINRVEAESIRNSAEALREQAKADTIEATENANTATGLTIAAKNDYYNVVKPEIISQGEYATAQGDYAKAQGEAVEGAIAQLAGEVSQIEVKDAVQSAKIKDIENVLSTANLGQSAQLSVSGVSPLSLPKNAANGGMSVKLEGLTEDVGGVITHFEPTGRVRSVDKNGLNPTALYLTAPELRSNGLIKDEIRKGANGYELVKRVGVGTLGSEIMQSPLNFTSGWTPLANTTIVDSDTLTTTTTGSIYRVNVLPLNKFVRIKLSGTTTARFSISDGINEFISNVAVGSFNIDYYVYTFNRTPLYITLRDISEVTFTEFSVKEVSTLDGAGTGSVTAANRAIIFGNNVHYTLATPVIIPIAHAGLLNSNSNGTVYFEPIIADAGVYDTKMDILLTDYPIDTIEEIIKHENGVDTYLNVATAVIAGDGLSFTHPDLASGDLVLFTYAFDKESTNGNITASFYDSNVVKIDTVTGKAYRINEVVTNGVLTRTLTEV